MTGAEPKLAQAQRMLHEGRAEPARALLQRLVQQYPRDAEAARLLSIALHTLGQLEQARFHAERACALRPGDAGLRVALGNLLYNLGREAEAVAAFERAIAVDARCADAYEALADLAFQRARFADSEAVSRRGLEECPGNAGLAARLSSAVLNMGRAREALAVLEGALAKPLPVLQAAPLLAGAAQTALYVDGMEPRRAAGIAREFGRVMDALVRERVSPREIHSAEGRRLRLGFVSGDFRQHSVAYFLEPLLERLDRDRFEIVCYHTVLNRDHVTERFERLADSWRQIAQLGVDRLAEQVASDGIDVLFDLAGHTDASRLGAFQMRPAPVQISYLGYPATTGMTAMDYRIVDRRTDPEGADAWSTERLIRLEPCFVCYRPPRDAPEISGLPSAERGVVTFGTFNVLTKVTDPLLCLWARVLGAVPGSRLLIKNQGLTQESVRGLTMERLGRAGIDAARVELRGATVTVREHLAAYGEVDIALDTFPYHGTTTTCEALHMGVPVVTLAGEMHHSRVGVSLLEAAGLHELVAGSEDEYVRIAAGLAGDAAGLGVMRAGLRERLRSSPLCDEAGFSSRFGEAVLAVWEEAVRGGVGRAVR